MVQYYQLGAEKRLNEIVMAGSHDAGITKGGGNAKTQKLDILGQAIAGVRVFDLRVAGADTTMIGKGRVELKTYHGTQANTKVTKSVVGMQGKQNVVQTRMTMGTWGEDLVGILNDAKGFVTTHSTNEFLILKFDKCKNWEQIAAVCVQELGTALYTGSGNVNKKTLFDLKGKVIVVFTPEGLSKIDVRYHGAGGILGIKSLTGGDGYRKDFDGIQYYGKGGTDMTTRKGKSVDENYEKQLKLMQAGAVGNPNVMGMMYWTTTGLVGSIKARNKMMWKPEHTTEMAKLWRNGMGDAVKGRIPASVDPASFAGGSILKRFLPNIVMIDFASPRKCQIIYNLNWAIPTELTKYEQLLVVLDKFA